MIIDLKKLTEEQIVAYTQATKETPFTAHSLVSEIKPLIEDVFLAEIKECRKSLRLTFPNGQEFVLYIKQI